MVIGEAGESVLILPKNSQSVIDFDKSTLESSVPTEIKKSNYQQWISFLTGSNVKIKY